MPLRQVRIGRKNYRQEQFDAIGPCCYLQDAFCVLHQLPCHPERKLPGGVSCTFCLDYKSLLESPRCRHRGEPLGVVAADACAGRVSLPLYRCNLHERCTLESKKSGVFSCEDCGDQVYDAFRISVPTHGIGDHILGLTLAAGWKKLNPDKTLIYTTSRWAQPWVELFDGYDHLVPSTQPLEAPNALAELKRGREQWVETVATVANRVRPAMRALPSAALAWAQQHRCCVVLAPLAQARRDSRSWLLSHWLRLEQQLMERGVRCVIIGAAAEQDALAGFRGEKVLGETPQRIAALMLTADVVVANESGMAHVAGALGAPCIVLAAQLDGEKVHGIWPNSTIIQGPLACSGCSFGGREFRQACWTLCASLQAITPEKVLEATLRIRHVGQIAPPSTASTKPRSVVPVSLPGLAFNPSIIDWRDQLLLIWRNGHSNSRLLLCRLDSRTLQPRESPRIVHLDHPLCSVSQEDPRFFVFNNRLHIQFTGVDTPDWRNGTHILYARLADDLSVEETFAPALEERQPLEKNWGPFEHDNELFTVYRIGPRRHIVGQHAGPLLKLTHVVDWSASQETREMRGGAAPVRCGDEYWSFYHGWQRCNDVYHYDASLYTFEARPPFAPKRFLSKPLLVPTAPHVQRSRGDVRVIFPGGAVRRDDEWLLAYGHRDGESLIATFAHAELSAELTAVS